MSEYAERWELFTLVDITKTGVYRGSSAERNQQRNFETLIQTISMHAQPWIVREPALVEYTDADQRDGAEELTNIMHTRMMKSMGDKHRFSNELIKRAVGWWMVFGVESRSVFGENGEILLKSLDNVPIITGLNETVKLDPPVFKTTGENSNLCIFQI